MSRFRPTRAGIVNLWDYRDEEFVFADGRLVLRGPNGSGKTKALEVLFPFVLDGRIEPRRLNPFASEDRTMKSNLLYRGQDSAHSYVWLEFGREQGETVTVGVGLRAQRHNDKVTRWYFVVDGRVGMDFSLLGPDDRPLTKKQLVAEIGPDAITDRAAEFRTAIDTRLFGLGTQRYEQLLTLVLTLRRPQLAKHLDPKGLSRTLSDGLRPLDDELIGEAARSFDDIEIVQHTLDGLVQADNATTAFLASYVTYLRTHARAATDVITRRQAAADDAQSELIAALTRQREAVARRDNANTRVTEAEQSLGRHRKALEALQHSKAYQDKQQLDKLAELVGELSKAAAREQLAMDRASAIVERLAGEQRAADDRLAAAQQAVSRHAATLAEDALESGIPWSAEDANPDGFDDRVVARVEIRLDDVRTVREALRAAQEAHQRRVQFESTFAAAERSVLEAVAAEQTAAGRLERARSDVSDALAAWWLRHEHILVALDIADVAERLHSVVDRIGEPDVPTLETTFAVHTAAAVDTCRDTLRELAARHNAATAELTALTEQRDQIASERDDAPTPFAARTSSRVDRIGAPLWRLVRFADHLTAEQAAGIEAALEASNLLDAWMYETDDATMHAVRTGDSDGYLVALPAEHRPAGKTLADVLVPESDTAIPAERVIAILSSVALTDGDVMATVPTMSETGAFAQGIQVGTHAKRDAEFIGVTARRRRRQARLQDVELRIETTAEVLGNLDREITGVRGSIDDMAAAQRELPRTGTIVQALRAQTEAAGALRATRNTLDSARSDLDKAIAETSDLERKLARTAAERGISRDPGAVDTVAGAVDRFRRDADRLTAARREESVLAGNAAQAGRQVAEAQDAARAQAGNLLEAKENHAGQAEGLAALSATVGADVAEVLAETEKTRSAIAAAEAAVRVARVEQNAAGEAAGLAQGEATGAAQVLTGAVAEAQKDARRLAPYAHREILDLLRVPVGSVWPGAQEDWREPAELVSSTIDGKVGAALPEAVVRLYEAIRSATGDLSPTEASLKSSKTRLSRALNELQAQLSASGHDYRPEWDSDDDVIVVRVADEQGFASIGDFARRISDARSDQELLLTESERRILEDALLGRLAQQIHERTIDAKDLIGRMNDEMRTRRMSSGTGVGVRWELSDSLDEGQRDVCRLLDRDASHLSPDELARMRAHFAARIKTTRAQHIDRSYPDLLAEVLDYRRWRTFAFTLIGADGKEEKLTQARHSTLSGGEQSVSLHLPLFAAAHVTLSSAHEHCPRLLALDEAFAGVDDNGRRELLGLTAQFDLDLFMTGYDLWATYDTVPACAHYDLSHSATEHMVSALLLVWDGKEILADGTDDLAAALGSPGSRRRPRHDGQTLLTPEDDDDG